MIKNLIMDGGSLFAPLSQDPLASKVKMLLQTNNVQGATNNVFLDSSANNYAITRGGNTTQGSRIPYPRSNLLYSPGTYGGSAFFDGTGDYLSTTAAITPLSQNEFTIEYNYETLTVPATGTVGLMACNRTGTATSGLVHEYNAATFTHSIYYATSSTTWGTTKSFVFQLLPKTAYKLAIERYGNTIYISINGAIIASMPITGGIYGTGPFTINAVGSTGTASIGCGYVSDLRVSMGQAVYGGGAVPVNTVPLLTLPSTVLHLRFANAGIYDGACISNFETVGTMAVDTAVKKYSPSALKSTSAASYLKFDPNPACGFNTRDYTIEYFRYQPAANTYGRTMWIDNVMQVETSTKTIAVRMGLTTDTAIVWATGTPLTAGQWYWIVIQRKNGIASLYANGVLLGSVAQPTDMWAAAGIPGYIGHTAYSIQGSIDGLRITDGAARYNEPLIMPTGMFEAV